MEREECEDGGILLDRMVERKTISEAVKSKYFKRKNQLVQK